LEVSWGGKIWPIPIWGHRHVHPYLGGGAAIIYGAAELDLSGIIVKDSRHSRSKVTLFDSDLEAEARCPEFRFPFSRLEPVKIPHSIFDGPLHPIPESNRWSVHRAGD